MREETSHGEPFVIGRSNYVGNLESQTEKLHNARFFEHLPLEIFLKIIEYLPLSQRFQLLTICRTWNEKLKNHIRKNVYDYDFDNFDWPLTLSELKRTINMSKDTLQSITLGIVSSLDSDNCVQLLVFGKHADAHGMLDPGSDKLKRLDKLSSLRINSVTRVFYQFDFHPAIYKWTVFNQLRELRIRIENSPEVVNSLALGYFPNINVLEFSVGQEILKSTNDIVFLDPALISGKYKPQIQVTILRVGISAVPNSRNRFPYLQKDQSVAISPGSLQRLLQILPNLEEFYCININSRRVTDNMMNQRGTGLRLNLRQMTPKLRVLDLSYSKFRAMPLMPSTCEVMRMNFCGDMGLRTCETFRGKRYYSDVLDSEGDGYFLDDVPDEYLNLRKVSLIHNARVTEKLFDGLARCNTEILTSLNLHGCKQIDFSQKLSSGSDFCKHYKRYEFFDDPKLYTIAELMVHMFPNLEELYVGCNQTLDDSALRMFTLFDNLRLVEICTTSVSAPGVLNLLLKDQRGTIAGELKALFLKSDFSEFGIKIKNKLGDEQNSLSHLIVSKNLLPPAFIDAMADNGVTIDTIGSHIL